MVEINGRRFPMIGPVTLPGAPMTGAEGRLAREVAHRLEDVRIAAAMLCGAAEQAELTIANEPALFGRLVPAQPSTRPVIAALEPLKRIVQACDAFEDAIAGGGESSSVTGAATAEASADMDARTVATVLEELAKRLRPSPLRPVQGGVRAAHGTGDAATLDAKTLMTIARVADMDRRARPFMDAMRQIEPIIAAIDAAQPYVAATAVRVSEVLAAETRTLTTDELAELERVGLAVAQPTLKGAHDAHQDD